MLRTGSLERPWCWERLKVGGEENSREWSSWMATLTWWTWVWVSSRSSWWTGRPGVLQSLGSQRVGHYWATELNWTNSKAFKKFNPYKSSGVCTFCQKLMSPADREGSFLGGWIWDFYGWHLSEVRWVGFRHKIQWFWEGPRRHSRKQHG